MTRAKKKKLYQAFNAITELIIMENLREEEVTYKIIILRRKSKHVTFK